MNILHILKYTILSILLSMSCAHAYIYKMSLVKKDNNVVWFLYDSHNGYEYHMRKSTKRKITQTVRRGLVWAVQRLNAKIYVEDGHGHESEICPLTGVAIHLKNNGITPYDIEAQNRGRCEYEVNRLIRQARKKTKKTKPVVVAKKEQESDLFSFLSRLYNWILSFFGINDTKPKEKRAKKKRDIKKEQSTEPQLDYSSLYWEALRKCKERIIKKIKQNKHKAILSKIFKQFEAEDKKELDNEAECFLNDLDTIVELLQDSHKSKATYKHSIVFVGGYHAQRIKEVLQTYFGYKSLCNFAKSGAPGLLDIQAYFKKGLVALEK